MYLKLGGHLHAPSAICRAHGRTTDNILKKLLGGFLYWQHPKEGHWEAICTRHWPSTPSSQTGQLKNVIVAFGGFRRFFVKCLHPLLSRNNSSLKHLNSFSISNGVCLHASKSGARTRSIFPSRCFPSIGTRKQLLCLCIHLAWRNSVQATTSLLFRCGPPTRRLERQILGEICPPRSLPLLSGCSWILLMKQRIVVVIIFCKFNLSGHFQI